MLAFADAAMRHDDYDRAIVLYERAVFQDLGAFDAAHDTETLRTMLKRAKAQKRVQEGIALLQRMVEKHPHNAEYRVDLALMLLFERQAAPQALDHVLYTEDEATIRLFRFAARPVGELSDAEAMDLGSWLRKLRLPPRASADGDRARLTLAKQAFEHALATTEDRVLRLQAAKELSAVTRQLDALPRA
jgi:tetratricopeptide (TPR) repeat protein